MTDVMVLGAGIVGVCVAIHLQRRGRNVLLPTARAGPRDLVRMPASSSARVSTRTLSRATSADCSGIALNNRTDARYDPLALPGLAPKLARYWWQSAPARYRRLWTSMRR